MRRLAFRYLSCFSRGGGDMGGGGYGGGAVWGWEYGKGVMALKNKDSVLKKFLNWGRGCVSVLTKFRNEILNNGFFYPL